MVLSSVPDAQVKLIVTSPPYNIGKEYEQAQTLDAYLQSFEKAAEQFLRVLHPEGSLCWQVGNYVTEGEIVPLDVLFYSFWKRYGFKLRNRVIWHFDHGLHAQRRFSGRYEVLLWFTRGDTYTFNLDAVRVPSKYPGKKHYKGPRKGQLSGNPLGKNPSDFWGEVKEVVSDDWDRGVWEVPNVKHNHPEKTAHPCQFPIEFVERCVLAFTNPGDLVLDPYAGSGTSVLAALKLGRRGLMCETDAGYIEIAKQRLAAFESGTLGYRELGKPIYGS
jgi:DNA modification methylase